MQDGDFDFNIFARTEINKPDLKPEPKRKRDDDVRQHEPAPKRPYRREERDDKPEQNNEKGLNKPQPFNKSKFADKKRPSKENTIKWDYNPKVAWEPDESDIANMIAIEKNDSMFQGEFDETGLSERVVSLLVSMCLHSICIYI